MINLGPEIVAGETNMLPWDRGDLGILKTRNIALVSLEEKIDTSSAAGKLVFHIFGAIAQFERRLIAERTRDRGRKDAIQADHRFPSW